MFDDFVNSNNAKIRVWYSDFLVRCVNDNWLYPKISIKDYFLLKQRQSQMIIDTLSTASQ